MKKKKLTVLWVSVLIIIIIDQLTKYAVRTTPSIHNWEIIPGWLALHYTQNPGMALGMDWASTPVISSIAILATIAIIIYILRSLDRAKFSYIICMGMILGGAFGNILDRIFMGYIESYGGFLEGHVVDFIHFTLRVDGYPVFPYIFNVADVSISIAIISLLLFHDRILPVEDTDENRDGEVSESIYSTEEKKRTVSSSPYPQVSYEKNQSEEDITRRESEPGNDISGLSQSEYIDTDPEKEP